MKLIVIEEKDIEIVYRFVVNVPEQMRDHDGVLRKQSQVRKNNITLRQIIIIKNFIQYGTKNSKNSL